MSGKHNADLPPPYRSVVDNDRSADLYSDMPPVATTSSYRVRAQAARDARLSRVVNEAESVIADSADQGELSKTVVLILPLRAAAAPRASESKTAHIADEAFHAPAGTEVFGPSIQHGTEVLFLPDTAGAFDTWQHQDMLNALRSQLGQALELNTRDPVTGLHLESDSEVSGLSIAIGEVHHRTENAFGIYETITRKALIVQARF